MKDTLDEESGMDTLQPLPSLSNGNNNLKSGNSSGVMTPDKLVTYCEEGTPVSLTRFSSISSLHNGDIASNVERYLYFALSFNWDKKSSPSIIVVLVNARFFKKD